MMGYPYYTGKSENRRSDGPAKLPGSRRDIQTAPAGYKPDSGLVDAVNVALLLGQPLLLTGEPGTGKTQLAYSLAWELGFDNPLIFETKSNSLARDLFYTYDALGHFRAVQTGVAGSALTFITWNALGRAILLSLDKAHVESLLPPDLKNGGERRSVVLIDEIDKAPRDFPNDLLNEIESLYFRVPELGNIEIRASHERSPVIVLTSNSEKSLPEAFLRRCVYYNIPFPEREELIEIVTSRVGGFGAGENRLLSDAIDLFAELRKPSSGLNKKPSTAELIGWLTALTEISVMIDQPLRKESVLETVGVLIKNQEDQKTARNIVEKWLK